MSSAFPSLGVRIDALGAEQATRKVQAFGKSVGALPRDMSEAGRSARKLEFNMQKMSFAMFGASLAITTTVTSLSRLDRAAQRVDKTQVALQRGQDLLARKQLNLNRIMKNGERVQGELAITLSEVKTAQDDLLVKSRELEIVTGEVSDTYINFAASLGASVLFAVTAFFSAVKGLNLAHAKGIIRATGHAISIGLIRKSVITTGPAVQGFTTATQASTIAMIKATFAAHGLAAGIKAIFLSLGPLGIAIAAGSALFALYTTNVGGVGDKINTLLGITEDVTDATDALGPSMDELNNAMMGVQETAPLLVETLDQIGQQIRFIAESAPAAASGIQQIQAQAGVSGGRGGGVTVGGGTLRPVPGAQTPLGIPALIGGTPTIPGFGTVSGPFDLSALPGPTLRAKTIATEIKSLETSLDKILRTSKQLEKSRAQIKRILASTKNDSEAIAIIEDTIVQMKLLAVEQEGELAKQTSRAAQALERALFIETLILQRKKEQLLETEKLADANVKAVNPLFDFLLATGQIGGTASFRTGRNGVFTPTTFGQGAGDRFLGFIDGSRINNPAFGQTLGGGASAAISSFNTASGGNFANVGAAAGLPGTPSSGGKVVRGTEQLLGQILLGTAGKLGKTEYRRFAKLNLTAGIVKVRTAVSLGLLPSVQELMEQGIGIYRIIGMAEAAIESFTESLKARGTAAGISNLGEFGADIFTNLGTRGGVQIKKLSQNRISSAEEFTAAIKRVTEAEERGRLIDELQRIINRRIAFNKFLAAEGPGAVSGTGVSLNIDITPMAEALEKILAGEDHNQFIKLTGQSKI